MKRSVFLTIGAAVVALVAAVSGAAQQPQEQQRPPRGFGRGMGPGGPGPLGMLQRLNLTDEQRTQIRAILDEQRSSQPDQKEMDLQKQLHEAVFADNPDQAKIDELKTAITAAHADALNAHVAVQLKIAQILTPEQRQQAREFEGRRGGGPGRGGAWLGRH
jgi:Spy/CpxP family protein refolding chaperone